MYMIYFLTLFFFFQPQKQKSLNSENIRLATTYLESYQDFSADQEKYLWAYNELFFATCNTTTNVYQSLRTYNLRQLSAWYSDVSCDNDPAKREELKLELIKKISLENGFFDFAIYYLVNEKSENNRAVFYDEFVQEWNSKLNGDERQILNSLKNLENLNEQIQYFKESVLSAFLVISNENYYPFDTNNFQILLENYITNIKQNAYEEKPLVGDFAAFIAIKAAFLLDKYASIKTLYKKDGLLTYFPTSDLKVKAFNALEYSLAQIGDFDKSLEIQRENSLPLVQHLQDKAQGDNILIRQSSYLFLLGKYQDAKIILEKLYNDPEAVVSKAHVFNNLAICYQKLGEKNKYVSLLLQALEQANNDNSYSPEEVYKEQLSIYRNLFLYYNSIGDSTNALPYIRKAESLATNKSDTTELAFIHTYLGQYYWQNFQDYRRAIIEFEKAEKTFKSIDNYAREIDLLLNRSFVYLEIDSLIAAEISLNETLNLALSRSDTPNYIEALIYSTELALKEKNPNQAKSILEEIALYPLDDLDFETLVRYNTVFTQFVATSGDYRSAIDSFLPIVDQVIERAKGTVDSESGFWTIDPVYLDAFETIVKLFLETDQKLKALTYLDRLKTINDASLYNSPLLRAAKLTEQELSEDRRLNTRVTQLRSVYLKTTGSERLSIKAEIDKITAQRQELANKVINEENESITPMWMIQRNLNNDELILHFTELNDVLFLSFIEKDHIELIDIKLDESTNLLFQRAADNLANRSTSLSDLYELYSLLSLDQIPDRIKNVIVIPDNYLYRIPLEVIPSRRPNSPTSFGSTRYMIEDYTFRYFTSLSEFSSNNRKKASSLSNDFSAFAISYFDEFEDQNLSSLPYATKEVRMVDDVLTNFESKSIFIGDNASVNTFKSEIENSRIVHIATHSEVSEKDPLFSTIFLKSINDSGQQEGQPLYAYELFDTQLSNDLIMLNSCSSGSGNYLQGSGIVGISRALRFAGAQSLGLNLWIVNDKIASEFAEDFYKNLNKGHSKSEAMRQAKIEQIKFGNADPHFWGAYSLIGNPSPIIKKPAKTPIIFSFLIAITLLVGYRIRKTAFTY